MAERTRPALASVTIRRLVLPEGETGHGLGEAVAAALARQLDSQSSDGPRGASVAESIARAVGTHPQLAAGDETSLGVRSAGRLER